MWNQKQWRAKKKKLGLCTVCGSNPARENSVVCQICLDANKRRRLKWAASGLCIFCGKNSQGKQSCLSCSNNKRTLGLSLEDRARALVDLENPHKKCFICGTLEPGGQGWQVDHDHETNEYRGLLCMACNIGLGVFKDSILLLKKAIDYLS